MISSSRNLVVSTADISLEPAPIKVSWVLEGDPQARNGLLFKSDDGTAWTMVWDCTAGRFNWFYNCDETAHVLEGSVTVTTEAGTTTIEAGGAMFFPAGSWATWQVDTYVRKVAFVRHTLPRPVGSMLRAWKRIIARLIVNSVGAPVGRGLLKGRIVLVWLLGLPVAAALAVGLFYTLSDGE
jgi:uncharacterized cupin superfamily protein